MKHYFFILFVSVYIAVDAQVKVSSGGGNPHPSAGFDVEFSDKGMLPPRLNIQQRNAIVNPASGLTIFNTNSGCINVFVNAQWREICPNVIMPQLTGLFCTSAVHTGTLTAGQLAGSVSSAIPYSGGNGEAYAGLSISSTGVTGLTASLPAGLLALGDGQLHFSISGTPSSPGTAIFSLNIAGQICSFSRTVGSPPFTCGTSTVTFTYKGQSVTYGTILAANGRCWLDRNLGAAQVASSFNDGNAYGDLFQWGRGDDGHQNRTSLVTTNLSSTDNPGHPDFIKGGGDWRSPSNATLWQGVNGINNPCPSGWRLATEAEWNAERSSWTNSMVSAFNSIRLTTTGRRSNNANIEWAGSGGYYWSSTVASTPNSRFVDVYVGGANMYDLPRVYGMPVRCTKD